MRVVYTPTARRHIAAQIEYLIDQGALAPARRLRSRIGFFITIFVARHPHAARYVPEQDIYEIWIPRTPYIMIYRLDDSAATLTVLALFHAAQDRSRFRST